MSSLLRYKPARATNIWFSDQKLFVLLEDVREIGVPIEWFPKLQDATEEELNNWRFIGNSIGIHWEPLDEDVSIEGLLN